MTGAALIVGASGVVGRAALAHFARKGSQSAPPRRPPPGLEAPHIAADLRERRGGLAAFAELPAIDRVVRCPTKSRARWPAGSKRTRWNPIEALLANCLDALEDHPVRHISLLQGN